MPTGDFARLLRSEQGGVVLSVAVAATVALACFLASSGDQGLGAAFGGYTVVYVLLHGTLAPYGG
tara:strand:+ start:5293 stop:5487 length:195 start_codon:yes stop_codon:yes gene_type:complete